MFWVVVLELIWIPVLFGLVKKFGFVKTWGCCIAGIAIFGGVLTLLTCLRGCLR